MERTVANAVDREAEWLATEPLNGFPPLLKSATTPNGGVFDYIGPRLSRVSQKPRQIHVYRERYVEHRNSTADKLVIHDLLLAVLWPISNVDRPDTAEQAALDEALDRLLSRIRGLPQDHTHGERFWSVGEPGELSGGTGIEVRMPEWRTAIDPIDAPLAAGASYVVEVRYQAIEFLTA